MGISLNIKDIIPKWVASPLNRFTNDILVDPYSLKVWKKIITTVGKKFKF